MRFFTFIKFEDNVKLPVWYRIGFSSLIKEAIKRSNNELYLQYYRNNKNKSKPFTFAVKLNVEKVEKEKGVNYLKLKSGHSKLYISSNNYEFITSIYNGLLSIERYNIYGNEVKIEKTVLLPEIQFQKETAVFNIFSPVVVRNYDKNKKANGYVDVNNEDYIKILKHSILSQCVFLQDRTKVNEDEIEIATNKAFSIKIPHYNKQNQNKPEIITATDGMIGIKAPVKILKLVYDIGLGARRNQGFGMLEVVE